jgi:SAM-dependent methyltransferase
MSDFDVNGLLDVYPMHLLGTEQFRRLLGADADGPRFRALLDVGAGSGDVTLALGPLFQDVMAFETSRVMRWRLRRRGVACTEHDLTAEPTSLGPFDVVACLNVLDRCRSPRRLLDHALGALGNDGRLLLALALPYTPFFYDQGKSLDPDVPLELSRTEWEAAFTDLLRHELEPRGLSLVAWTRAPYLSGGDARRPLYVLDDALLVLERR